MNTMMYIEKSKYNNASRQLDSLWADMDPLLSISLPIPKKPIPQEKSIFPGILYVTLCNIMIHLLIKLMNC